VVVLSAVALVGSIGLSSSARAQAPSAGKDKATISKACTEQANAQGLHGKARKKFRATCKKNGGKEG
jgi:hypothetical protein